MDRFLVTLSLGPVQSLIGAARSTRDLWCGSWLLSEAARAAARVLHEHRPGCLIFPCPKNPAADLESRDQPEDTANIANILRAEVVLPDAAAARALCEEAKSAAVARLTALGNSARNEMERMGRPVREEVWRAQIDDILEGFAAWALIPADSEYKPASQRLDGALETVLPVWLKTDCARRKLRLSDGEQLDALGVTKRLAGDSDRFTAFARIAADSWIERLSSARQRALRAAYEPLVGLDLATRTRGNDGIYKALPFDAMLLYAFRMNNALSQARDDGERRALRDLRQCIDRISRETAPDGGRAGAPVPYAAILKADGDRMGALLSDVGSADRARSISRALHGFASDVRGIVREHRGHAIYAGGDDVLALLPLALARECAEALARAFADSLAATAAEMNVPADKRPTLSVGLGIGHVMEPLGALRACAERAERAAKGDATETPRNALAIILRVRSGAEVGWRARWSDAPAFDALDRMIDAFRNGLLPTRAAYDLRAIDRRLAWLRDDDSTRARGMRGAEVGRMLDRARIEGGAERISDNMKDLIVERAGEQSLEELAETLIVARWLSARAAGDLGERA